MVKQVKKVIIDSNHYKSMQATIHTISVNENILDNI